MSTTIFLNKAYPDRLQAVPTDRVWIMLKDTLGSKRTGLEKYFQSKDAFLSDVGNAATLNYEQLDGLFCKKYGISLMVTHKSGEQVPIMHHVRKNNKAGRALSIFHDMTLCSPELTRRNRPMAYDQSMSALATGRTCCVDYCSDVPYKGTNVERMRSFFEGGGSTPKAT